MNTHDFTVSAADGTPVSLRDYAGRYLLIVNVASKCGFTPQYEGLEALHRATRERGVEILGFPCNQFGEQEPGTDADIQEFCSATYDVTFPVLRKIEVNGPDADPLYTYLRGRAPGDAVAGLGPLHDFLSTSRPDLLEGDNVRWNFTKFLVDPDGEVLRRYESIATPDDVRADLEPLLAA